MIISMVFVIDLIIKFHVDSKWKTDKEEKFLNNKIILRKYYNKGAVLNAGETKPGMVMACSIAFIIALIILLVKSIANRKPTILKVGYSLILGGALNNLYDRIKKGYVVDYFSFNVKNNKFRNIIFNVSDMFILVGAIIMMISEVIEKP